MCEGGGEKEGGCQVRVSASRRASRVRGSGWPRVLLAASWCMALGSSSGNGENTTATFNLLIMEDLGEREGKTF